MLAKFKISSNLFHAVLLSGTFFLFLGLISRLSIVDLDLFHEMALFREALRLGELPDHDLYSYIPTVFPVVHHEWGVGAILYFVTVSLGLGASGLMGLKFFLTFFILINCYRFALQRGCEKLTFIYCAFFAVMLGWIGFTTIRAQLFTLFLLLILLFIIERDRKNEPWIFWSLVPLFILWINLHGGFVVGMGLTAFYILERYFFNWTREKHFIRALHGVKKQLLVFACCCLGLLLNPYGIDYFPYLWEALTLDRTDLIMEWRPVWEVSGFYTIIYCAAVLLILHSIWYKSWKETAGLPMVLLAALAGLQHFRHLSLFALLFLCYVPGYLKNTPAGDGIQKLFNKNTNALALLYVFIAIFFGGYSFYKKIWQLKVPTDIASHEKGIRVYPVGAVHYLEGQNFRGNLMTPYNMGAYVSWKMYPEVKVGMDSRFEVAYPYEEVLANNQFYKGEPSWYEISLRYDTDALLVPNWAMVKQHLDDDPGIWRLVYKDGAYTIYMVEGIAAAYPVVDLGGDTVAGSFP